MARSIKTHERDIELEILNYFKFMGVFCWKAEYPIKINSRNKGLKAQHPFIRSGVPDILAISEGVFIAIEVKTPEELAWWNRAKERIITHGPKNKKDQRFLRQCFFIEDIKNQGGWGGFASSREEARAIFKEAKENRRSGAARPLPEP